MTAAEPRPCEAHVSRTDYRSKTGVSARPCYARGREEVGGRWLCGTHAKKAKRELAAVLERFEGMRGMRAELRRAISLVLGEAKANGSVKYSSRAMRALRDVWESKARSEL